MIVRVNIVLKRTVVVARDLRLDNLCSSYDNYEDLQFTWKCCMYVQRNFWLLMHEAFKH